MHSFWTGLAIGGLLCGAASMLLTRWLMLPHMCPRCNYYLSSRDRLRAAMGLAQTPSAEPWDDSPPVGKPPVDKP